MSKTFKTAVAWSMWSAMLCATSATRINAAEQRANIVVILADDMGYSDIGCYGGEIQTPNLDRLAESGLRFTQFYNAARCAPTRATVLSGMYPQRAGMGSNGNLGSPAYQGHLANHCVTIAEVLREAGYATSMVGKWHLGNGRPHWPIDHGFDRYFGLLGGANSFWEVLPGQQMALDDKPWRPDPKDETYYFTDRITDYAIEFMEEANKAGKPFFCYIAHTAPHWPLHAWPEDIAKYRGRYLVGWDAIRKQRHQRQIKMELVDPSWKLSERDPAVRPWDALSQQERKKQDLLMSVYAAMVDRMDQSIGRVVQAIDRLGQGNNTLIMFLSDNGGCHIVPNPKTYHSDPSVPAGPRGGYAGYGAAWANASNTPFRKFKQFAHEGGIATPLIVHWPDRIGTTGRIVRDMGHAADLLPTCLDVAGAPYPNTFKGRNIRTTDGNSLVPIFDGKSSDTNRVLYWEHNGHPAVRVGKWKLVALRDDKPWELYNLETDRTECHDLIHSMPDKAAELNAHYERWASDVGVLTWKELQRIRRGRKKKH